MTDMTVETYKDGVLVDTRTESVPEQASDAHDRIAALEAKLTVVESLATKANATAQEVAQAVKDAKPTR